MINEENNLTVDLYHGTSTLFLDSIVSNGLGGINPVKDWNLLELSKEVYGLSVEHLQGTQLFQVSSLAFKLMTEQKNSGSFNFQHGDTYLSASKITAANYAISKSYGSEILTYTINFLQELIRLDIPYVIKDLYRKYTNVFELIEANPSPLLIQISNVNVSSLQDEHGSDPQSNLDRMKEVINEDPSFYDRAIQQCNFRLLSPVTITNLKLWLINVQRWNPLSPLYNLYQINEVSKN